MSLTDFTSQDGFNVLQALADVQDTVEEVIQQRVQIDRKYPNGFEFLYHGETAIIKDATYFFDHEKIYAYIVYLCDIPSWGEVEDTLIRVPEFALDRLILEK